MRSKPSQHVFSVIDLAEWAPRITKYKFANWIPRMNEAAGLIVGLQIQLKSILGSNARCLFGPGNTWTSSPKMVPTPLILFGTSPPCMSGIQGYFFQKRSAAWVPYLGYLFMYFPGRISNAQLNQAFFRAEFGDTTISPAASFVLGISFITSYFCDSLCPFGQIDNQKHMSGRFRSQFQKMCWLLDLKRESRPFDFCK